MNKLIKNLATRWHLAQRENLKDLEDLDFILNDSVTLTYALHNLCRPMIETGDADKIKNAKDYFKTLTEFFLSPTKQKINEIISLSTLPPNFIEKLFAKNNKPKTKFLESRPLLKYCIVVLGSTFATGIVSFFVFLPYANNEPLTAFNPTLQIAGVAAAISGGLSFIDSKRSSQ